jgi:hypothetical protein
MASIQQAAKWMQQGKRVRRSAWDKGEFIVRKYSSDDEGDISGADGFSVTLLLGSLLAKDWEIAE